MWVLVWWWFLFFCVVLGWGMFELWVLVWWFGLVVCLVGKWDGDGNVGCVLIFVVYVEIEG